MAANAGVSLARRRDYTIIKTGLSVLDKLGTGSLGAKLKVSAVNFIRS